jgi:hypothetical protein
VDAHEDAAQHFRSDAAPGGCYWTLRVARFDDSAGRPHCRTKRATSRRWTAFNENEWLHSRWIAT